LPGYPAQTGRLLLGPLKQRCLDSSVLVSLEALVPRDHFYRQLEAKLDLGFVREFVGGHYETTGRPSIDPLVFFKLQLIMFFEGPLGAATDRGSSPEPGAPLVPGLPPG